MINMKTRRVVVLDFDGTLVDSAPAILHGFDLALRKNGLSPIIPLNQDLIGPPLRVILARLTGREDAGLLDVLASDFKQCYDGDACLGTQAFPGVGDALDALASRGHELHLATNKRSVPTGLIVEQLGWTGLFTSLYCMDEHPDCENKAQLLGKILTEHALIALETPYVGDIDSDSISAQLNSMPYIHAAWGYGSLTDPARARICASPSQLLAMIERSAPN